MFHTWKIFLPWTYAPLLEAKWMPGLNHALREASSTSPTSQVRSTVDETCSLSHWALPDLPKRVGGADPEGAQSRSRELFHSKSSAVIFTLASCPLPAAWLCVGMFTFPLARCADRLRGAGAGYKGAAWGSHTHPRCTHAVCSG